MVNVEECQNAYNNYGVDLIRTGGLLMGSSPSSIFRASVIFQRFQRLVSANFRAKYMSIEEVQALHEKEKELFKELSTQPVDDQEEKVNALVRPGGKIEFLIPEYVEDAHSRGTVRLGYIFAPIEYCVYRIIMQEDIVYIAAACLLISSKMEDQHVRIRPIVKTYARLTLRRCGLPIMPDFAQDEGQCESFKACVVEAEEIILHQVGFQTFVEAPFKYLSVYLSVLITEEQEGVEGGEGETVGNAPSLLTAWLTRAVQEVNDYPRCAALLDTSPSVLAVMALDSARPDGIALPDNWTFAFGVTREQLDATKGTYEDYKRRHAVSAKQQIDAVRRSMSGLPYRSKSQWAMVYHSLYRKDLLERNEELYKLYGIGFFPRFQAPSPPPPPPAATGASSPHQKPQVAPGTDSLAMLSSAPAITAGVEGAKPVKSNETVEKQYSAAAAPGEERKLPATTGDLDGYNFEDIKSIMKRRRQEEKEEHKRQKRLKEEAQQTAETDHKHSSHHDRHKAEGKERSADKLKEEDRGRNASVSYAHKNRHGSNDRDHNRRDRDKDSRGKDRIQSPRQRGGSPRSSSSNNNRDLDGRERRDYDRSRGGRDDHRDRSQRDREKGRGRDHRRR